MLGVETELTMTRLSKFDEERIDYHEAGHGADAVLVGEPVEQGYIVHQASEHLRAEAARFQERLKTVLPGSGGPKGGTLLGQCVVGWRRLAPFRASVDRAARNPGELTAGQRRRLFSRCKRLVA